MGEAQFSLCQIYAAVPRVQAMLAPRKAAWAARPAESLSVQIHLKTVAMDSQRAVHPKGGNDGFIDFRRISSSQRKRMAWPHKVL